MIHISYIDIQGDSWWERLFHLNTRHVINIHYYDEIPRWLRHLEKMPFIIHDRDYSHIIDWLIRNGPVDNINKLTFLSVNELEYIKLKC